MTFVVDMIPVADGDFVIAGNANATQDVFVARINGEGEIIRKKSFYGQMLWHARIVQKPNDNILIPMGNFNPVLLELTMLGDSAGSVSITEKVETFFCSVGILQDSLIFVSELFYSNIPYFTIIDSSYLVKISPSGSVLERYPLIGKEIMDIMPVSDSSLFVLVGATDTAPGLLRKYSIDGALVASTDFGTLNPIIHRLYTLADGSYLSSGIVLRQGGANAVLAKIKGDCQISYCHQYNNSSFSSVAEEHNGQNAFLLGQEGDFCVINSINSSGGLMAEFLLSDSLTGATMIYRDSYLYVTGIFNYLTDPRAGFLRIHKDSLVAAIDQPGLTDLQVFPNPASSVLNVALPPQGNVSDFLIEIIDIAGKIVLMQKPATHSVQIDTRQFQPGLYLVKILYRRAIVTRKIVIR
jgi:hypothetical protein